MAPAKPSAAPKAPVVHKPTPENDKFNGFYDFGGTIGNIGLMIFSHTIPYYLWLCVDFYGGSMVYPGHPAVAQQAAALGSEHLLVQMWNAVAANAAPTAFTFGVFSAFLFFEWVVAATLPGVTTIGLPVPSENNYQYKYLCNAVSGWYVLLVLLTGLHYTDVLPLQVWRAQFPSFMTCAIIWADGLAVIIYLYGVLSGWSCRMSGNVLHDFFMGSIINPRLPCDVDLKMFAEIRNSWSLLFILAASSAAQLYTETGVLTNNFIFLLACYGIYTNACQKGEECIVTSWDIAHEKFGWMLIYWNFAGVPFVYASIALYQHKIVGANPALQWTGWQLALLYVILLAAYYVFDTANAQKNRFRMVRAGVSMDVIRRKTFPALPWAYIENPKTITGPGGRELLVDGWFKYARKIHYTADIVMTFLWGLSCGWDGGLLPFFYFIFFFGMINHREARDFAKCKAKYGEMWDRYTALVPNAFIPTFSRPVPPQKKYE